jgi:hypothetical protein
LYQKDNLLIMADQTINSQIGNATGAIAAASSGVNAASNLGSAISSAFTGAGGGAQGVASAIRSIDLPAAGEAIGDIESAIASFGGDGSNANDWRVRLSMSSWSSFRSSPVLKPLKDAGGLIFPYTPTIKISSAASYSAIPTVHTNYSFQAYKSSDPGTISITAPMYVEDPEQGLYWIAMVHYLRSLTKMFSGADPKAGNPPPVIMLNGYGNYVFKNVPVVVKSMSVSLTAECDYIGVEVFGSAAGELQGITDSIGGLSDTLGSVIPGLGGVTDVVGSIAGGVGQVAGLLGTFGIGGKTSGGITRVPTKSSFQIELMPVYSRDSVRKFSLDRFVTGGYLTNPTGYI